MTYSLDVIGTFKTFVAFTVLGQGAALANIDKARKRSDGPSMIMEFGGWGEEMNVFLDRGHHSPLLLYSVKTPTSVNSPLRRGAV